MVTLVAFVLLGVRDPDIPRRGTVWPMAASFGGLAVNAAVRTLAVGGQFAVGPGVAAWLVISALLASAGRPIRLAVDTSIDPVDGGSTTEREKSRARNSRRVTLLLFLGGLALAGVVWLVLVHG